MGDVPAGLFDMNTKTIPSFLISVIALIVRLLQVQALSRCFGPGKSPTDILSGNLALASPKGPVEKMSVGDSVEAVEPQLLSH